MVMQGIVKNWSHSLVLLVAGAVLSLAVLGCKSESSGDQPQSEAKAESADKPSARQNEADQQETESAKNGSESAESGADESQKAKNAEPGAKKVKKADLPDDMPAGTTKHFGADFTVEGDPITLATAVEKHTESEDRIKVAASIEKVCKKKGCWFTLAGEDVDRKVRVRMKDYGFFVPRNTDGADVVVEGTIEQRTMTEKEAKHYAEDEGRDPSSVDKDELKVYEFTASGVQITRES